MDVGQNSSGTKGHPINDVYVFNLYLESDGFLGDVPQLPGRLVVLSLRLGLFLLAVSVVLAALGIP